MLGFLLLAALLLSGADHWTTYLCLSRPLDGYAVSEANPLTAWLFQSFGLVPGLVLDAAVTLAAVVLLMISRRVPYAAKVLFLVALIGSTSVAVANNLEVIAELGISPLG
jgi:Domain of unknown function (DUF5658)